MFIYIDIIVTHLVDFWIIKDAVSVTEVYETVGRRDRDWAVTDRGLFRR